jgi:hypothetical protein
MRVTFAYLDAGSVSMFLTAVAGGVAGVAVFIKSYARRLTGRVLRRPAGAAELSPTPESQASEQG